MKYLKNNDGAILIVMLFTAAIISMIGFAFISTSFQEYKISHYEEKSLSAYYMAEGGLQKTLVSLKENPNWKSSNYWNTILDKDIPLGNGTYNITFKDKGDNIIEVISKGEVDTAVTILRADVKITKYNKIYENLFAINSDTATSISGNIDIYGDMHSNTDITVSGNTNIYGDVISLGNTTFSGNHLIEGDIYSGGNAIIAGRLKVGGNILARKNLTISVEPDIKGFIQINGEITPKDVYDVIYGGVGKREPVEIPKLTERRIQYYRNTALENGTFYESGNFPNRISGVVFADDNVKITGGEIRGSGILFVNGDFEIGGNASIRSNKDEIILVISTGRVKIHGEKKLECVFFTPHDINVKGNFNLHGGVIAKNISGNGNLTIHSIEDIQDKLPDDSIGDFETYIDVLSLKY